MPDRPIINHEICLQKEIEHLANPSAYVEKDPGSNRTDPTLDLVLTKFHHRFKMIIFCFIHKVQEL